MLGGALRGFNLLLVLAGLMVGALLMQWRWSRRSIESVTPKRTLPDDIFAGRDTTIRYSLQNHSHWIPAWMLRVEDPLKTINDSRIGSVSAGIPLLPPTSKQSVLTRVRFEQRGRYELPGVRLLTCFPFSLSTSTRETAQKESIYVFPRLYTLRKNWRRHLECSGSGTSANRRRRGPAEGEFFGLRGWQNGDSIKWIHWRTSARLGDLAVRQFEHQRKLDACIAVDAYLVEGQTTDAIETCISLGASIATAIASTAGDQTTVLAVGREDTLISGVNGERSGRRMLECLATLEASDQPDWASAFGSLNDSLKIPKELIVVSTRSLEEFQSKHRKSARALDRWSRRGNLIWIDVRSEVSRWVNTESLSEHPSRPRVSEQGRSSQPKTEDSVGLRDSSIANGSDAGSSPSQHTDLQDAGLGATNVK